MAKQPKILFDLSDFNSTYEAPKTLTDTINKTANDLENNTETQGADVATEKATNFFDKAKAVGTFIGAFTLAKNKPYIDAVVNPIKEGTKQVGEGLAQTFPSAVPATFPTAVPKKNLVAGAINTATGVANTGFGAVMTPFNLGMESARQAGLKPVVDVAEKVMNAGAEGFSEGADITKDNLFGVKGSDKRKSVELAMNYLGLEPQEMSEIYQAGKGAGELLTTMAIFHGAGKTVSTLKSKIKGKPIAEKQQIIIEEAKTFSKNENWQNKVLGVEKQLTQNAGKSNFPDVVGTIPNFTITGEGSKVQSFYPPKDKYFDSPKQTKPLIKEQGSPFAIEEVKNTIKIDESTVKDLPTLDELQKSTPKGINKKIDKGIVEEPKPIEQSLIIDQAPKNKAEAQKLSNLAGAQAIRTPDGKIYIQNDKNHQAVLRKLANEVGADKVNEWARDGKLDIGFIEDGKFTIKDAKPLPKPEVKTPIETKSEQPKKTVEVNTGKKLPNKSEMEQKKVEGAKENQSEMPDKQTFGQNDLAPKKENVIQEKVQGNEKIKVTTEDLADNPQIKSKYPYVAFKIGDKIYKAKFGEKADVANGKIMSHADLAEKYNLFDDYANQQLNNKNANIESGFVDSKGNFVSQSITKDIKQNTPELNAINKKIQGYEDRIAVWRKQADDNYKKYGKYGGVAENTYSALMGMLESAKKQREKILSEGVKSPTLDRLKQEIKFSEIPEVKSSIDNINKKSLGQVNMFADPTIIKDYATVGYHAIKQGFKKFSDWSAKMIETFTDKIKPYLLKIWDSVKKEFGKQLLELDAKNPFSMTKSVVEDNPFLDRQKVFTEIQNKKIETKKPTEIKEELASDIGVEVNKNVFEKTWDFALTKSETRLRGFGKAGNELADKFKKALEIERDNAGKGEQYLYDMNKLSKEELKNLEDIEKAMIFQTKKSGYNNPIPKPISKNVENIVNGVNAYYKDAFNRAKEAGLEVNELPNYRPRILNIDLKDLRVKKNKEGRPLISDKRKQILEKMVKEGTAKNIADASFILDNYIAEKSTKKSTHLEYSRTHPLPKEYYITDPKQTLLSYVLDAEKRIANAKEFGVKDELVKDIYENIRKESGDKAVWFARDVFKYETGKLSNRELEILEYINLAKGVQTVTKFSPFTTLRNSLQGILGSSIRGNFQTAFKGLLKSFTNEVERNAYKSGALHDQISKIITKEMGGAGKITDSYLKLIGFTKTDIVNRIIASASGEAFYTDMLGRLKKDSFLKNRAIREFNRMGLDSKSILERGKFNESELNLIRRTFAGDTQFNVRPIDLPLFWSSPTGKLLTQWKSFGYKMGEMVYKNVIGEAKKGNLAPLTTMLVAYGVSGEAVNMIIDYTRGIIKGDFTGKEMVEKSLLGGDLESNEVFVRILNDVAGLGALGVFVDVVRSVGYGKHSQITGAVFGPIAGEVVESSTDLISPTGELINKGTTKNLDKNTVKGALHFSERNLVPGSGTFRTFGLWKWVDEQAFPKSSNSRTSSRTSRQSRTSR